MPRIVCTRLDAWWTRIKDLTFLSECGIEFMTSAAAALNLANRGGSDRYSDLSGGHHTNHSV